METDQIERWVDGYVAAWRTNDPNAIARLFTADARYFPAPDHPPWQGRDAIVAGWLERRDDPSAWTFRHQILAVVADLAIVRGWTAYLAPPRTYSNLWLVHLTPDGRCSEFTEWWMEHP